MNFDSVIPRGGAPGALQSWVQAARPAAFPMLFLPLLTGQAAAFHVHDTFGALYFVWALCFGALYQVYLLYTNDAADEAVDRESQQYWLSGGSRVLAENKLRKAHLLVGANVALGLLIGMAAASALLLERPWFPVAVGIAVLLSHAYHHAPLRMSYRGHGEVLQGLGCGVILPLTGFYLQHGSLQGFIWTLLIPMYLVFHAGNIVTALPDFDADSALDKRTLPVRRGQLWARTTALLLLTVAYLSVALLRPHLSVWVLCGLALPACSIVAAIALSSLLRTADTADFSACKRFVTWASASQAWFLLALIAALLLRGEL